jgi:hypothetical protein
MAAQFFECLQQWRSRGPRLGLNDAVWQTPWTNDIFGVWRRYAVVRVSLPPPPRRDPEETLPPRRR